MSRCKKRLALVIFLGALLTVLWLLSPASPFIRHYLFVDLHTGRIRSVKYVAFVKLYAQVEETDTSQLWGQYFGTSPEPEWQVFVGREIRVYLVRIPPPARKSSIVNRK